MNVIELIFGIILILCLSICAIYFITEKYKYLSDLDQMRKTIQKERMEEAKRSMEELAKALDDFNDRAENAVCAKAKKTSSKKSTKKGE